MSREGRFRQLLREVHARGCHCMPVVDGDGDLVFTSRDDRCERFVAELEAAARATPQTPAADWCWTDRELLDHPHLECSGDGGKTWERCTYGHAMSCRDGHGNAGDHRLHRPPQTPVVDPGVCSNPGCNLCAPRRPRASTGRAARPARTAREVAHAIQNRYLSTPNFGHSDLLRIAEEEVEADRKDRP